MSGTTVIISIIKAIQKELFLPKYSIDICLFDGEEIGLYGSKRYVSQCNQGVKLFINFDTCGYIDLGAGVYYDPTHPELELEFQEYIKLVKDVKMKVAEYKPEGYVTDCRPFELYKIPYVSIMNSGKTPWIHTYDDAVSIISFEKLDNLAKGTVQYLLNNYNEVSSSCIFPKMD